MVTIAREGHPTAVSTFPAQHLIGMVLVSGYHLRIIVFVYEADSLPPCWPRGLIRWTGLSQLHERGKLCCPSLG
jgi:hypothetical protein